MSPVHAGSPWTDRADGARSRRPVGARGGRSGRRSPRRRRSAAACARIRPSAGARPRPAIRRARRCRHRSPRPPGGSRRAGTATASAARPLPTPPVSKRTPGRAAHHARHGRRPRSTATWRRDRVPPAAAAARTRAPPPAPPEACPRGTRDSRPASSAPEERRIDEPAAALGGPQAGRHGGSQEPRRRAPRTGGRRLARDSSLAGIEARQARRELARGTRAPAESPRPAGAARTLPAASTRSRTSLPIDLNVTSPRSAITSSWSPAERARARPGARGCS